MTNEELMQLFSFTNDDLRHNQSGHLSPAQQQRLASVRRGSVLAMLVLAAAALLGVAVFARQLINNPLPLTETGLYWLGSLVLAIIAGWLLFQVLRPPDQSVAHQRGQVQLVQHQSAAADSTRGKITYEMWIGGERFTIDQPTFSRLEDGQDMIIYYTRGTLRVLSTEIKESDAVPI